MNRKMIMMVGAAISVMSVLLVVKTIESRREPTTLRIGAILPLSGEFAFEGEKALAAIKLAENEINSSEENERVEILFEDGKFTSKDSVSAYNRLKLRGVDALVSFGTPSTLAIKDIVESDGVPMLIIDGTMGVPQSSKWIFRCLQTTISVGEAVAKIVRYKNFKRPALFCMSGNSGDDFRVGFKNCGPSVVCDEKFSYEYGDIKATVQKLISTGPDCICIFGYGMGYVNAINTIVASGFKGTIITDMNLTSVIDKLRIGSEKILFASLNYGRDSSNKASFEFIMKMQNKYNVEPTSFSAFSYEAIRMLASVKYGSPAQGKREAILDHLLSIKNYNSVVGVISYDPNGELTIPFDCYSYSRQGGIKAE